MIPDHFIGRYEFSLAPFYYKERSLTVDDLPPQMEGYSTL
jgi:hypothetical protein